MGIPEEKVVASRGSDKSLPWPFGPMCSGIQIQDSKQNKQSWMNTNYYTFISGVEIPFKLATYSLTTTTLALVNPFRTPNND